MWVVGRSTHYQLVFGFKIDLRQCAAMKKGFVKWFDNTKGFGFICSDKKDFFVHYKEIKGEGFKALNEGDSVSFTEANSARGPIAKEVSKCEP